MENATKDAPLSFEVILTAEAVEKIRAALESQSEKNALRLEARAGGGSDFKYSMRLISLDEQTPDDILHRVDGLQLVVDSGSARNLNGATIDYEDRVVRSGFKFQNPNKPETPRLGSGPRSDLTGPVADRVQFLLDSELNPAVAAHGGQIGLVGVRDNKVYLSFGGGCHGCGMVDVTLKQGVEARIREVIPEIEEVVDTTDHSTGENPFYA